MSHVSLTDRQGLLGAYRSLGVVDAEPLELDVTELTPELSSAHVRWALRRDDGSGVYNFTAFYTLVVVERGFQVAAVAHDELPKLQAALAG